MILQIPFIRKFILTEFFHLLYLVSPSVAKMTVMLSHSSLIFNFNSLQCFCEKKFCVTQKLTCMLTYFLNATKTNKMK